MAWASKPILHLCQAVSDHRQQPHQAYAVHLQHFVTIIAWPLLSSLLNFNIQGWEGISPSILRGAEAAQIGLMPGFRDTQQGWQGAWNSAAESIPFAEFAVFV